MSADSIKLDAARELWRFSMEYDSYKRATKIKMEEYKKNCKTEDDVQRALAWSDEAFAKINEMTKRIERINATLAMSDNEIMKRIQNDGTFVY